jgi:hypothetical protein
LEDRANQFKINHLRLRRKIYENSSCLLERFERYFDCSEAKSRNRTLKEKLIMKTQQAAASDLTVWPVRKGGAK